MSLGGLGGNSKDLGIKTSNTLFAPRLGVVYRMNDDTVFRAGFGRTFNPLPWARPIRDPYPLVIAYSGAGLNGFVPYGSLRSGIPGAPNPDLSTGNVLLPRGVAMRTPDPDNVERGTIDSWNVFVERRLPLDFAVSMGYVGTATRNGYMDINLNTADSGGNANRALFAQAGNANIFLWGANARSNYNSLQVALNRPFKGGLLLKGAYTLQQGAERSGRRRARGAVVELSRRSSIATTRMRDTTVRTWCSSGSSTNCRSRARSTAPWRSLIKNWQINGIGSWLSGTTVPGER